MGSCWNSRDTECLHDCEGCSECIYHECESCGDCFVWSDMEKSWEGDWYCQDCFEVYCAEDVEDEEESA